MGWEHVHVYVEALLEISFLCNFYAVPVVQSTMDLGAAIVWIGKEEKAFAACSSTRCSPNDLVTSLPRFALGVFAFVVHVCGEDCGAIISSLTFESICRAKY